jgi:hypothetical protein
MGGILPLWRALYVGSIRGHFSAVLLRGRRHVAIGGERCEKENVRYRLAEENHLRFSDAAVYRPDRHSFSSQYYPMVAGKGLHSLVSKPQSQHGCD